MKVIVLLMPLIFSGILQGRQKQASQELVDVEFVIVIPSYKNEQWAADNLASACNQKSSRPYQVICVNDCSPDRTGEIMDQYVKDHHLESKVKVIHNKERRGAMANWYNIVHSIPDHKVVVNLDGDDLLAHNEVLLTLEKYYKDKDIWLTYGSGISYPAKDWKVADQIPDQVFIKKKIREHRPFVASHLRTFKAGLFKKIKKEDLMVEGVDLVPDMAFMLPMLEMCSPTKVSHKNHSVYIPDILYLYRTNNPINLFRILGEEQDKAAQRIWSKKSYMPIASL